MTWLEMFLNGVILAKVRPRAMFAKYEEAVGPIEIRWPCRYITLYEWSVPTEMRMLDFVF